MEGHRVVIREMLVSKRSEQVILDESEMTNVPQVNLINVEEIPRASYEGKPPEKPAEDNEDRDGLAAYEIALAEYEQRKASWEEMEDKKPKKFNVNLWVPVTHIQEAKMDNNFVKIFHSRRGPIIAQVITEDLHRAFVYSPSLIDSNVHTEKIHFFPLPFTGFSCTIYKTGLLGESIPQRAELLGYASFINRNKAGDYRYRMRAAYHHIDAGIPADAKVSVIDAKAARDPLFGLMPTSDEKEAEIIEKARRAEALKQQQQQQQQPAKQQEEQPSQEPHKEVAPQVPPVPPEPSEQPQP